MMVKNYVYIKEEVINTFLTNRFVIELDERYYNQKDLIKATCEYLNNQGKNVK